MRRLALLTLALLVLAGCGATATPVASPVPTTPPAPTEAPTEAPTAAPPTATPSPEETLIQLAQKAAAPNLRDGAWAAKQQDLGQGPEVQVTMPLNLLGSNEQIVRLNQTRIAGVMKAVFDTYPDVVRVNVIGTSPVGDNEAAGISLAVTRAEYTAWSGRPPELPGWQVSQRFQ